MKVVFRVDASLQMGSGHVMRCLTLADSLAAAGAQCHLISRAHEGNMLAMIRQRGYGTSALPAPTESTQFGAFEGSENDSTSRNAYKGWLGISWEEDAEQTRVILKKLQPDWLVVDHYALDQRWEAALRPHPKNLMVIDDLADRNHLCNLLLDQNLGRQKQDYDRLVPAQCLVLAGPQYALLRPEFAAVRTHSLQRRQRPALKQLLITMGGVDQPNATGQVLQALKNCTLPSDCQITVVMGLQSPWLPQVRAQALAMPWPTQVLVNISDMAQRMADSDLAIGAAGCTSWERCCLGLPTLMVVLAENQLASANGLQAAGAVRLIGHVEDIAKQLPVAASQMRCKGQLMQMVAAANSVTDGLGVDRVLHEMRHLN